MNTIELLDAVRAAKNLPSDYAAAAALWLTRSQVSKFRLGKCQMGDETAARAAELIGADPGAVLASMYAARARDDGTRALWRSVAERLQRGAVAACVILSLGFWTGGPDGGALAASATPPPSLERPTLYIMSTRVAGILRRFGSKCRQLIAEAARVAFRVNALVDLADIRP